MKKNILYILPIFLSVVFIFTSCDDDDEQVFKDMALNVTGLPELGDFYVYEGWLIDGEGTAFSTGTFFVDNGANGSLTLSVDEDILDDAERFVITIEPSPDPDPSPSPTKILAGEFIGESATLTYENDAAIGTGFTTAAGKYILATPTNGEDSNELSGIWWLNPDGPKASLILPDLNEGWIYEGWAVIDGTPVSTGKFSDPSEADLSDLYSGTLDGPAFPGEDFLTNAPGGLTFPTDLSGSTAVISVEPSPDNLVLPFVIKPLTGDIPDDAIDHVLYDMVNNAGSITLSGTVTR
jgi:hypothetical protein